VVLDSQGTYTFDLEFTEEGVWYWSVTSTGVGQNVTDGSFSVRAPLA
jgi:hypothetical protein